MIGSHKPGRVANTAEPSACTTPQMTGIDACTAISTPVSQLNLPEARLPPFEFERFVGESAASRTQPAFSLSYMCFPKAKSARAALDCQDRSGPQFLQRAQESNDTFPAQHAEDVVIACDGQLVDSIAVHLLERSRQLSIRLNAF